MKKDVSINYMKSLSRKVINGDTYYQSGYYSTKEIAQREGKKFVDNLNKTAKFSNSKYRVLKATKEQKEYMKGRTKRPLNYILYVYFK